MGTPPLSSQHAVEHAWEELVMDGGFGDPFLSDPAVPRLKAPRASKRATLSPDAAGVIEAATDSGTPRLAAPDDGSVIDSLRRGDEGAFARLVDQYHASLRRVARLYVSDRAVADEVVQDTWLGVIRGIWAFEGRSSLKTWILRILINRAKTRAGRDRRMLPFARFDAEVEGAQAAVAPEHFQLVDHPTEPSHWVHHPVDLGTSPECRLLAREARQHLQSAIDALPEHQRLVLILRDVEGCSTEEVCNALGFQETNTRVLLHRARAKVRAALEPYLKGA